MSHLRAARAAILAAATMPAAMVHAETTPAPPRPSTPMTLPEVLRVAIRQSPALTRAVVDVDIAHAEALAAEGLDDFTLTAGGRWTHSQLRNTQQGTSLPGRVDTDSLKLELGLVRGLATGGTLSGTAFGELLRETFTPNELPDVTLSRHLVTSFSIGLVQPVLRGYGKRIARADVRRAAVARDVATLQQMAEALKIARDVITSYWEVAYALQVIEIRAEALKLASEQLQITERGVRTGSVSPTETLAAELTIANREQAVLLAQVELSQLSLDLRRLAGLEIGRDRIDLSPTTALQPPSQVYDVDAMIARALAENPLIALLEAKAKGADIDVEVTEDAIRPRLDVRASLATAGNSIAIADSFKQLATIGNPSIAIGVTYEQQIGARAARGARDKAKALRRRLHVDLEETRREVTASVAHAIDLLRAAQKRIEVADRAINLARRSLEVEQTRFLNGKATNFDVKLRQDELQNASVSRALAVADALAAQATIDALTGDLLVRHHIRIVP